MVIEMNSKKAANPIEVMMSEIKLESELEIPVEGKDRQDIADSRVLSQQKGDNLKDTEKNGTV